MPTVTVACKLPNGLHLDHMGKRVTLNGAHHKDAVADHGLTTVDKDFWDAWHAAHKDYHPVKHGHIFAHVQEASAKDKAKERAKEKTGFEGIDPKKPGNGVKPLDKDE